MRYNYADTLNAFYRYSNNSVLTGSAYGVRISNYDSEAVGDAYWKEFGFLNCGYGTFSYWDLPEDFPAAMPDFYSYLTSSQQEDVRDFVVAILTMTDEQFEEENGRYPVAVSYTHLADRGGSTFENSWYVNSIRISRTVVGSRWNRSDGSGKRGS